MFKKKKSKKADNTQKTHKSVGKITLPSEVTECLKLLYRKRHKGLVVGGLVRNLLSNRPTRDADITTSAPIEEIEKLFNVTRSPFMPNLCRFTYKGMEFDISSVATHELNEGVNNRDFTINALYANHEGKVFDPTGRGIADLNSPDDQLKTILPDDECYNNDPIRILRFLYFRIIGFKSKNSNEYIENYLNLLKSRFDELKVKLEKNDDENIRMTLLETQNTLRKRFEDMMYKLFLSDRSAEAFKILSDGGFFKIFFSDIKTDSTTQNWLRHHITSDLHSSKNKFRVRRNSLYEILLVAMLDPQLLKLEDKDLQKEIQLRLETHPFPIEMRWKLDLEKIKVLLNDKHKLNLITRTQRICAFSLASFGTFKYIPLVKQINTAVTPGPLNGAPLRYKLV